MERDHSALELGANAALQLRPGALSPDAVPPLRRGSMPAAPWYGFGEALRRLLHLRARPLPELRPRRPQPWQEAARHRRQMLLLLVLTTTALTSRAMADALDWQGVPVLASLQLLLFVPLMAWVSAGFWSAVMGCVVLLQGDRLGLSVRRAAGVDIASRVRTAIVMPICNEHVQTVIAGLKASCESLAATGLADRFDVFLLSDSRDPAQQAAERAAWLQLRTELAIAGGPRLFYRVRQRPGKRKAGNVADFCRRWGRDYRYMIVLDADSVMSGACLTNLVRLMEVTPRAGIIQTLPRPCGQPTLHARAQQFSAYANGKLFAAGMQYWQLGDSHYWGHNAIIRVAPFMRHCGLARLPGKGPLSGDILSHDFAEAALMRRAGYDVWIVPDLDGSFEQVPHNLLAELQRDRRWCQGNLLNARLLAEPGLAPAHRAMLVTGVLAYASAPLWLAYLLVGTLAWWYAGGDTAQSPTLLHGLWLFTATLLLLPRLLGIAAIWSSGQLAAFGGGLRVCAGAALAGILSVLQAPIRMFAHTGFVFAAVTGVRLDWISPPREASGLSWREASNGFLGSSLLAAQWGAFAALAQPAAALWLAPVYLPVLLAVPLAVLTGDLRLGQRARAHGLLLTPEETLPPPVLRSAWRHARQRQSAPGYALAGT